MVLPITNPTRSFWIDGADSALRNHRSTPGLISYVNNYRLQLPPPYNTIILGSGKPAIAAHPEPSILSDEED
ncbi:hypothetical protein L198_04815 [Cryptococcus wingfieldii CBS 7118]|uniref:Uncharacterized protein n=1 Tax=Cryptococcus wingfieldii CBS 7118 TaxID=1295528 RepID=A0A1E3J1H0_9TREE|nr:hypothetical protein L198_04815 [Cryptococcus wingfieldii CBS 7118]ODN94674.1 hypothetical protein L198_04815 [Cryptococcus wingfieldii CBS 7118]